MGLGVGTDHLEHVRVCDLVTDGIAPPVVATILEQPSGDPDLVFDCGLGVAVSSGEPTALAEFAAK